MSKQGRWSEMGELVTDEMLNTFGIVGEPSSLVPEMKTRFGDIVDSTSGNLPSADRDMHKQMIAELRA